MIGKMFKLLKDWWNIFTSSPRMYDDNNLFMNDSTPTDIIVDDYSYNDDDFDTPSPKLHRSEIKEGDRLVSDGLCCLKDGITRVVYKDEKGELYVKCSAGVHHLYADDSNDNIYGFRKKNK